MESISWTTFVDIVLDEILYWYPVKIDLDPSMRHTVADMKYDNEKSGCIE